MTLSDSPELQGQSARKKNKRGQSEGSIYRYRGGWSAVVTIPGTGTRRQFYGKTKKEVQQKADDFRLKLHQGLAGIESKEPLASLLERWLDEVAEVRLRPKTVEIYRSWARKHVIPSLGKVPLNKLTTVAIQSWVSQMLRSGASPATVRNSLAVLRRCLRSALGWQLISVNPAIGVEIPPLPQREYRTLTPAEYHRLLAVTEGTQLHSILMVELYTGLRKGEVLALRWGDIYWTQCAVSVQGAMQRTKGKYVRSPVKTRAGRRTLAVPQAVMTELRAHWERTEYLRLPDEDVFELLIFTSPHGRAVDPSGLTGKLHRALEQAGLPKIRFHDLRHTFATLQLEAGIHPGIVSERLGHTRFATTMDIHTHVSLEAQRPAAEHLSRLLEAAKDTEAGNDPHIPGPPFSNSA